MYDYLAAIPFAKIEFVPQPLDQQLQAVSHAGVDGLTIWDNGQRADQVTARCTGYVGTYNLARGVIDTIKSLERANPITVTISGLAATNVKYQVMRVNPIECRRLVFGRGPAGLYYARIVVDVTLQPIAT